MLTKFKAEVKARFEEDHAAQSPRKQPQGKHGKDGGGGAGAGARTATQVHLCVFFVVGSSLALDYWLTN